MKRTKGNSPPSSEGAAPSFPETPPPRVVSAGEHSTGFVGYDDLGRPRWSWMNELDPAYQDADSDDVLNALDTTALSLADEPGAAAVPRAAKEQGYDPYDTARIKVGDRFRRR